MTPQIDVLIEDKRWNEHIDPESLCLKAIAAAQGLVRRPGETEVSVLFSNDDHVRRLNSEWRGIDKPTNVLSFEAAAAGFPGQPQLLGDIALAFETVLAESREQEKSFSDHAMHLVVHGYLHLLGMDHEDDDEAEEMEALETRVLAGLGIADPYADRPRSHGDEKGLGL